MKTIKPGLLFAAVVYLSSACLANPSPPDLQPDSTDQNQWQTYTSSDYDFTIQYPPGWQVIEPPTPEFPSVTDQVWLVSETLPLPQTGSRADIVLIFTEEDPSPAWEPHNFDDYQSDVFWLGDLQARKITGVNKESGYSEIVVLGKIGDYYFQALPNHGQESLKYFDQVISSIRSVR